MALSKKAIERLRNVQKVIRDLEKAKANGQPDMKAWKEQHGG